MDWAMFPAKPTVDQMWKFIDHIIHHNQLIPDRKTMTYEQVFLVYSKLYEVDLICNDIKQINILKKEVDNYEDQI